MKYQEDSWETAHSETVKFAYFLVRYVQFIVIACERLMSWAFWVLDIN